MSDYIPDRWVILKIDGNGHAPIHKVFACWFGGWAGSDSWKLNSGITKVTLEGFAYSFEGSSGSVYECHKDTYGTNMYGMSVLSNMIDNASKNGITIEILPEETNWLEINYE
jgi:hypothetical protein